MGEQDVVAALSALGFNLNEGRAYAALLGRGPSTGYEISQHAGIPRSAVYSVLRTLVTEGALRRSPGPPERFSAAPPDTLLAQLSKRFDQSAERLRESLKSLEVVTNVPDAYGVQGYERILEEATSIMSGAERLLVVSGWPREIARLAEDLARCHTRQVYIVLFSHAHLAPDLTGVRFSYGLEEQDLEAFWQHKLVVVADDEKSLLGSTEQRPDDRAVVSHTKAIAEIAVSQIALDITLLAQRHHYDAGPVLAKILGDRIGRLDTLLAREPKPALGEAPEPVKPKRKR